MFGILPVTPLCAVVEAISKNNVVLSFTEETLISSVPNLSTSPALISDRKEVEDPVTLEELASFRKVPVKLLPYPSVV